MDNDSIINIIQRSDRRTRVIVLNYILTLLDTAAREELEIFMRLLM